MDTNDINDMIDEIHNLDGIDNVIAQADTLYAPYIFNRDGKYVINPRIEPDDIIWVLTKIEPDKYKLDVYPGAYKYILDDPKVFLNGADFEVSGKDYVSVKETGTVFRDANGTFIVEKKPKIHLLGREKEKQIEAPVQKPVPKPQTQEESVTKEQKFTGASAKVNEQIEKAEPHGKKLYSQSILPLDMNNNNSSNFVYRPRPTPDEDTIFELTETSPNRYQIGIYPPAYARILANPSFIDGTNKQVIGFDTVLVKEYGIAEMDANGKLIVITPPSVWLVDNEYMRNGR